MLELERRDIGSADNLVIGVHVARCPMCHGVFDLDGIYTGQRSAVLWGHLGGLGRVVDFYFKKIFGGAIDLLKALLPRVRHCLHIDSIEGRRCNSCEGRVDFTGR